ncbi:peroxisomal biogenesis factor 3 [Agrilus planipennis]|uniref:Peroxisomal biogenesis factor 3 n=1 Tax=Agrilus planipennis TaxID=224129 RepID=A0A1W4WL11_AGRPL|nr:peroxisomal biogenesis factor 3 [Agrilus planipennis]
MPVLSRIRDFFYRHKNKFIVSGVIITGSILLTRYAQQKLREWQEQHAKEFLERTRKQQHFESTERTCNQTILSLLNPLLESLSRALDTDAVLEEIKRNPGSKIKLWEELKVKIFAKVTCFIYIAVVLVITCRLQLGLLGGHLFKNPDSVSPNVQEKYLLLCNKLLQEGIERLSTFFEKEYSKILGPLSLKKPMKLVDLEKIFWDVQTATKNSVLDPVEHMKEYIIPKDKQTNPKIYDDMIQDTADIIESDEIKTLATSCISRGFILLGDSISEFYKPQKNETGTSNDTFIHPSQIEIALAKLIPILSGIMTKNAFPEHLIQQLITHDKLKVLSANIYEAFS